MSRKTKQIQLVDEEPQLKSNPMYTTDEFEIKVNSLVYRVSYANGYQFKGEAKVTIEALRVFHVNNTARIYRLRCAKGCEEVFKVADGCSRVHIYGSLSGAIDSLEDCFNHDIKKCSEKTDAVLKTWSNVKAERARVRKIRLADIKIPKEVKAV